MNKIHKYPRENIYRVSKYNVVLFEGTWNEVLEKLNISESTMRYYLSNSYKNRISNSNKRLTIELIER